MDSPNHDAINTFHFDYTHILIPTIKVIFL